MNRYKCIANLTGISNNQANNFYVRCNDTLGDVDMSVTPFSINLKGSAQTLAISSATPNGTLIQSASSSVNVTINVQTVGGTDGQGTANCYYNDTINTNRWIAFGTPASYSSSVTLWLPGATPSINYNFPIKCVDPAGNVAYTSVSFNVQSVTQPPNVVRASHSGTDLTIQTNVNATCVYDIIDCTYPISDGTSMTTSDGITFTTTWVAGRTYYIKCQDAFGNQPPPNSCTNSQGAGGIILAASET